MPNWCEGVLKIRGKKKDLIKFINEGIERYGHPGTEDGYTKHPLNVETDEFGDLTLKETDEEHNSWLCLKDSRRCFIEKNVCWYWNNHSEEDLEKEYIQCLDIKQAWRLEPDYFKAISKKYNIDFKIIGIECGIGFLQEIEVIKGEMIYKEKVFENYKEFEWDVYDPRLGG